jgi:hypothetical protein
MDIYSKIADKVKDIAGTKKMQQSIIFSAQVEKVEGKTCSVLLDELSITDVRLKAVINDNDEQLFVKPKVGSYVLVADLSGGEFRQLAVIAYSEIESINIKIGETTMDINQDGIILNGGKLKGVVKVDNMVSWMLGVYNDLLMLRTQLASWTVAGNGAPLGLVFNPTTQVPQVSTFANEKIKQ